MSKKKKKKKKEPHFNERLWLNSEDSSSTGSIVCYDGLASWGSSSNGRERECFVEVADCHVKARLHICRYDSHDAYLKKVKEMRDALSRYIVHLEKHVEERRKEK